MEAAEFNARYGTNVPADLSTYSLANLARLIRWDWRNVSIHAEAYLGPMAELQSVTDNYYADTGKSVVRYFLANATGWRGPVAKAIKAELQRRVK